MTSAAKRRFLLGALVLAAAVAGGVLAFGVRLSLVLAGYETKMLCSEVFVAGRDPADVLAGLAVDDLRPLRFMRATVDWQARTTRASLFGVIERQAQFRGDVGCAVIFDGTSAGNLPAVDRPAPTGAPATRVDPRLEPVLDEAFFEPDPLHLRRTRAVVVWQDGRLIAERYAAGWGPETRLPGWSMTKSVLNALVGILVGRSQLSLAAPAPVPAWQAAGDGRRRITLEHLLRMTSGLRVNEDMASPLSDVTYMLFRAPDMAAFATDKELAAEPGTRWQYSNGTSLIIARILRNTLGDAEYRRFPRQALFARIGMDSAVLEMDASGTYVGSSYMYATARDWTRFGALYLQDGVWDGQRILPKGWVEYTRTPADTAGAYGAHFWLRLPAEYGGAQGLPVADAFHAVGHEAQFVTIVPSRRTVIVRLGKTRHPQAWNHARFVGAVLDALRSGS